MAKLVNFRMVGRGPKLVRVHKVELTRSKTKGELMVKLQLKVKDGEYTGETLFTQAMLEGKGAFFGMRTLSAIVPSVDWRNLDVAELPSGEIDVKATEAELIDLLVEEEAIAYVKHTNDPVRGPRVEVDRMVAADADVELVDDEADEDED